MGDNHSRAIRERGRVSPITSLSHRDAALPLWEMIEREMES